MFAKLWSMLQELERAAGSKAKTLLLKVYLRDDDFVWLVKNALDQGHSFGVDALPDFAQNGRSPDKDMVEMIEKLKTMSGVSDVVYTELYHLMCESEARYNVVLRILRKDLRCGVAAKTINKVIPNLIFRIPYQRCASADYAGKMSFKPGAILQRKANGMFAYLLPDGTFVTRKGERSKIEGNIIAPAIAKLPGLNDKVLAVELVVLDNGIVMNRAAGNGLINSFFKGNGDIEVAKNIRAYTWLYLTEEEFYAGKGNKAYRWMWDELTQMIPPLNSPILPIESWYVASMEEAKTKTNELIAAGEEGTVLKSMSEDFFWADEDPSYFQIKLKAEAECEFEIIDAYEGDPTKKYAGLLGGVTVKSSDGKIISDVGGGFTDLDRKRGVPYWKAKAGSIATIKFNGITEENDLGIRSLDHPRIIEIRTDKTEADTYETCRDTLLGVI